MKTRITDAQYALIVILFGGLGLFNVLIFLALHLDEVFTLTNTQIAIIVGTPIMIAGLGSWLGGRVADRFGSVAVVRYGFAAYMLTAIGMYFSPSVPIVFALVICIGVIRAMTVPAMKTLIVLADNGDGSIYRLRHMVIIMAFGGSALGAAIWNPEFHRPLFLLGAFYFAVAVALSFLRQLDHHHSTEEIDTDADEGRAITAVERRKLAWVTLYGFLTFFSIAQFETSFPLYLRMTFVDLGDLIYRTEILISAVATLSLAVVNNYFMTRYHDRLGHWPVIVGSLLSAIALLLIFGVPVPAWIYIGGVVYALGEVLLLPLIDAMTAPITRKGNRAQVLGLVELRQISFFAGPLVGGLLLDNAPSLLAPVLAIVALAVIPVYFMVGHGKEADRVYDRGR